MSDELERSVYLCRERYYHQCICAEKGTIISVFVQRKVLKIKVSKGKLKLSMTLNKRLMSFLTVVLQIKLTFPKYVNSLKGSYPLSRKV